MTDLDDLIARLLAVDVDSDHDCYMNAPIFAEAAAALEDLRDENERLRVAAAGCDKAMRLAEGVIVAKRELFALAEARNAIRAALKHQ